MGVQKTCQSSIVTEFLSLQYLNGIRKRDSCLQQICSLLLPNKSKELQIIITVTLSQLYKIFVSDTTRAEKC